MKRELSYREEMVQQLHIVRGENNKAEGADTRLHFLPELYRVTATFPDVINDAQTGLCIQDLLF